MPIAGLVITLSNDGLTAREAEKELLQIPALTLGPASGTRIAGVLDTPDETDTQRNWEWLNSLPGVEHVDVVYVAWDTEEDESPDARRGF